LRLGRRYLYELAGWPALGWCQDDVCDRLATLRHGHGRLVGGIEALPDRSRNQLAAKTIVSEIVASAAIEGIQLPEVEVRSAVNDLLGLPKDGLPHARHSIQYLVDIALDVSIRSGQRVNSERIWGWHAAHFPNATSGGHPITVGDWRKDSYGPMQVVSGLQGEHKVQFEAPPAERVALEMNWFLDWFGGHEMDPVIKAAIAHLWFVTIHPFDDGNGRIARLLSAVAILRGQGTGDWVCAISPVILRHRVEYYDALEGAQKGSLDVTEWVLWFLGVLSEAIAAGDDRLQLQLAPIRFWDQFGSAEVSARQRKVIDAVISRGQHDVTTSSWAAAAGCSQDSAHRDIRDLIAAGVLIPASRGGRSASYSLRRSA